MTISIVEKQLIKNKFSLLILNILFSYDSLINKYKHPTIEITRNIIAKMIGTIVTDIPAVIIGSD